MPKTHTPHASTPHASTPHASTLKASKPKASKPKASTSNASPSLPATAHQERFTNNGTGIFTRCPSADTHDLIVGKEVEVQGEKVRVMGLYLQHKIGQITGKKPDEVLVGTPISIARGYGNSEGVIDKMQGEKGFVKGLRFDLQKAQVIGGRTYATFQIQWGTGQNGKTGGAYAGALMEVDKVFSAGDLQTALTNSFQSLSYWRIDG